jgi:serine phosphatase RsbU (regulator of sigma subunit)
VSDTERAPWGDGDDWAERTIIQLQPARERRASPRQEWLPFIVYREGGDPAAPLLRREVEPVPLRIGRREPCELVLRDTEVSGLHCQVQLHGNEVVVTDLGSTNGSFIDGVRLQHSAALHNGSTLQVGGQFLKLELRDRHELAQSEALSRDLERASHYVQSLLPAPWTQGPLLIDWCYQPSAKVGGDGFGYFALDAQRVVLYTIDVSGHGVGAAMHLVAVMNVLRQRNLQGADLARPAEVLAQLNHMFQMDRHDGMLFSAWYGVVHLGEGRVQFASGGHHPAYLMPAGGGAPRPLHTRNPCVGAVPGLHFTSGETPIATGDRVYLFSDGVFEITARDGTAWSLDDFVALLGRQPAGARADSEQLRRAVRQLARPGPLEDDFSLLSVTVL